MSYIEQVNKMLDEVEAIDIAEFPYARKFVHMPLEIWTEHKRDIVRLVCLRSKVRIDVNGAAGGGYRNGEKIICFSPMSFYPPVEEAEMEKNIDQILSSEVKYSGEVNE